VGAAGSCIHPVPFCTAVLFSHGSHTITSALRSDAVAWSYAREREHTQTCPPSLLPLLARPLMRAPALPLSNGQLCSCAGITPRVRDAHICAHTCSKPACRSASLSFISGCRSCHARQGQCSSHPPTRTPSRATCQRRARAPAPRCDPLQARHLRGCVHTRPRRDLQHTNCWEGKGKKIQRREEGGGGERKRENDRLQSPLSA